MKNTNKNLKNHCFKLAFIKVFYRKRLKLKMIES